MLGDGLVFAGGAPRSGLTLLRALASSHPDIAAGPDTNICAPLCAQYNDFATNLGALHRDHFNLPPKTVQQNFAEYIAALFGNAKQPERTKRILEKSALNVLAFEQLHAMLPGAQFIHVVRDGRDVVASLLNRDWRRWRDPVSGAPFAYVSDASAAANYWAGLAGVGFNARQKIGDPARLYELRYERLIDAPVQELQSLCEFLGVPFAPSMLDFHQVEIELLGIERDSADMLSRPLSGDAIGRYQRDLTSKQLSSVATVAKPVLDAFGYC